MHTTGMGPSPSLGGTVDTSSPSRSGGTGARAIGTVHVAGAACGGMDS